MVKVPYAVAIFIEDQGQFYQIFIHFYTVSISSVMLYVLFESGLNDICDNVFYRCI